MIAKVPPAHLHLPLGEPSLQNLDRRFNGSKLGMNPTEHDHNGECDDKNASMRSEPSKAICNTSDVASQAMHSKKRRREHEVGTHNRACIGDQGEEKHYDTVGCICVDSAGDPPNYEMNPLGTYSVWLVRYDTVVLVMTAYRPIRIRHFLYIIFFLDLMLSLLLWYAPRTVAPLFFWLGAKSCCL